MSSVVDLIRDIPTPFNMVVLVVLIVSGAGVISNLITQIRKYVGQRQELEFKRELLDQGMSIDEIERIMRSGGSSTRDKPK
jgi:hypothetical protein